MRQLCKLLGFIFYIEQVELSAVPRANVQVVFVFSAEREKSGSQVSIGERPSWRQEARGERPKRGQLTGEKRRRVA